VIKVSEEEITTFDLSEFGNIERYVEKISRGVGFNPSSKVK
jgi:hypothetical protein